MVLTVNPVFICFFSSLINVAHSTISTQVRLLSGKKLYSCFQEHVFAFETCYLPLAGLELALCNRPSSNLQQFCFFLLNSEIAGVPHHA